MITSHQLSSLDHHVLGRDTSLFGDDLRRFDDKLGDLIEGRRFLALGAAGSIGSRTLGTIAAYNPSVLHVVDHNENGLAELTRQLRSSQALGDHTELVTLPFDIGGRPFALWLERQTVPYDYVLNFAALKHVRTEKDPYSILAMLETNVLHLDRLSRLVGDQVKRVFSVSTDKAANPASMMGATKRLMEHALFLPTQPWGEETVVTSARFANVAFSNGSLLQSWQYRLAANQPLACPAETRRFFVSLDESGHLCTLAALLGTDRTLLIPALHPEDHLELLSDVVERFLAFHGYDAVTTDDPDEASRRVAELSSRNAWPVLLTPLDTGGEKPYEEFVGEGEQVHDSSFAALRELGYRPPADPSSFADLVTAVAAILSGERPDVVTTDQLKDLIATVEPAFAQTHRASTKLLDERM